jgi:polysaccharide biosynthesis protein PslG
MKLPNESNFFSRIPTPVLVGVWLLAAVMAGGCLFWALFAPSGSGNQAASVSITSTRVVRRTVTPTTAPQPAATVAPTSKPATLAPSNPSNATPAKATKTPRPTATPTTLPINETFGYGIQVNGLNDGSSPENSINMVSQLKMTWIKQQVKWGKFESQRGQFTEPDTSYLEDLVKRANQSNVKVMLSIVSAPVWSHPGVSDTQEAPPDDPNAYANFVGRLLDRLKSKGLVVHAIEVWNEQNLDREWHTNPQKISAGRYLQLLSTAYKAIKSKDQNIVVISGALSPTGQDDGVQFVDDFKYLQQMISYDLLNNADCIGVHHNGINLPPDTPYQDAPKNPKAATASYRGPFDNPHHSWSFYTTLNETARIVNKQKPLCITEFGWPTAEGMTIPVKQGFEFAKDNSLQDQANYTVQAFQLMRQWGFVKIAFLWNLNFNGTADSENFDNVPYSILDSVGMPRPAFNALGAMPKP